MTEAIWRDLALILATVVVMCVTAYLSFGRNLASKKDVREMIVDALQGLLNRTDVSNMIEKESPWVRDKGEITASLKFMADVLVEIKEELREARRALVFKARAEAAEQHQKDIGR